MKAIKYYNTSFDIDFVLSLGRAKFVRNYLGTHVFKGVKQEQMLNDCFDKCLKLRGGQDVPLLVSDKEEESHDNSTDDIEME